MMLYKSGLIENEKNAQRVQWIDVAKGIGIYAIWLGHMGPDAGMSYEYVFFWHINLFFFLSGCVENYNNRSSKESVIHKCKTLLMPFYFFAIQSIFINLINNDSFIRIKYWLIVVLKGCVRNQFLAGSLWFLTCLFSIELIFIILNRLLKNNRILLLVIASILFIISIIVVKPNPQWIYNMDSALYYLLFYVIGYLGYPIVLKAIDNTKYSNVFGVIACVYNVFIFMRRDGLPMPGASYAAYYGLGG